MATNNPLLEKLRYHVTGAIERGEAEAIEAKEDKAFSTVINGITVDLELNYERDGSLVSSCFLSIKRNGVTYANSLGMVEAHGYMEADEFDHTAGDVVNTRYDVGERTLDRIRAWADAYGY